MMTRKENGAIMIEATIVMIITIIVLVWILGIGFLYYQKYVVTATTNDAAKKVAATYDNPESDLIMGYIDSKNVTHRNLYLAPKDSALRSVNRERAENYIKYMLDRTNFAGTVSDVQVNLKLVTDSSSRKHILLTSKCTFDTPFSIGLDFLGTGGKAVYTTFSRAECTDIISFYSEQDFLDYWFGGKAVSGAFTGAVVPLEKTIRSAVKLINSIKDKKNYEYSLNGK